jgi:hypothetical protein
VINSFLGLGPEYRFSLDPNNIKAQQEKFDLEQATKASGGVEV